MECSVWDDRIPILSVSVSVKVGTFYYLNPSK